MDDRDLEAILGQVRGGDPVGAAYRLSQVAGATAAGRLFYEAGSEALGRRDELGDDALRFARLVFAEAVEREPDLVEAHHDLATTMRELGMVEDALPHYRRALELVPDDEDALIGLGAALADLGRLDDALEALRHAADAHPDSGRAQANLAIALEAAGHDEDAVAAYGRSVTRFEAAVQHARDDEDAADAAAQRRWARIQHAEVLERLERWPQAIAVFRRLHEEEQVLAAEDEEDEEDEDGLAGGAAGDVEAGRGEGGARSASDFLSDIEQMLHTPPGEPGPADKVRPPGTEPEGEPIEAPASVPSASSPPVAPERAPAGAGTDAARGRGRRGVPAEAAGALGDETSGEAGGGGEGGDDEGGDDEGGDDEGGDDEGGDDEVDPVDPEEEAGRHGLERVFSRLVQLRRLDLAYVVLDDLGGEVEDERTRSTYTIYDPGDGAPTIMVERWDDGARERLDPERDRTHG